MPETKRLTEGEVKGYSHDRLVGDFEVASRLLFDDASPEERDVRHKNLNLLRRHIYDRMR